MGIFPIGRDCKNKNIDETWDTVLKMAVNASRTTWWWYAYIMCCRVASQEKICAYMRNKALISRKKDTVLGNGVQHLKAVP